MPSSSDIAVAFSVDVNDVAFALPGLAVKALFGPQVSVLVCNCVKVHRSIVPFTLQKMIAFMPLMVVTVQLNVNAMPGHVGELGAVNCPSTSPVEKEYLSHGHLCFKHIRFCTVSLNASFVQFCKIFSQVQKVK